MDRKQTIITSAVYAYRLGATRHTSYINYSCSQLYTLLYGDPSQFVSYAVLRTPEVYIFF